MTMAMAAIYAGPPVTDRKQFSVAVRIAMRITGAGAGRIRLAQLRLQVAFADCC